VWSALVPLTILKTSEHLEESRREGEKEGGREGGRERERERERERHLGKGDQARTLK
jgi:hypothetical protein